MLHPGSASSDRNAKVTRRLRIAIATAGRFHVLDLARELHALGHDVKFYSYVPKGRAARFGLPKECHVSLLPFVFPLVAWDRYAPGLAPRLRERLLYFALNAVVKLRLQRCDIFHCMSGMFLEAATYAKKRYGSRIWIVRGSRHILSQDEILAKIPGSERPSRLTIRRELAGYAIADRIAISSHHVKESFARDPETSSKLVVNPYGVDLTMFPLRPEKPPSKPFIFLSVGNWSLQKGSDILEAAIKRLEDVRLLHVGAIGDLAFPDDRAAFEHIPPVPQWRLPEIYARADVFILASRQDGFGIVITQALASGLPVICSDMTGASGVAHTPALAARIEIVPHDNVEALTDAMAALRDELQGGATLPPLTEADRETLSWRAYAERYSGQLQADFESR